ncbi:MAG: UDP-2,3-diacylglucosamine diphosphatase [Chitinispirillaceae bacterium]|nr:UDP-2,3-diacylglucosamine diphosphatase [Chitinispirillaceae bacterium]
MDNDTLYVVSDAHLGASFSGAAEWERSLIAFLRFLRVRASALYLLGDLFDFWIEYRHAIRPDYFRTVHELKNLVEAGIPVHYFAGNHDFALGPFLSDTVGIEVHPGHADLVLQGRKVHLYHGDGIIRRDVGYRVLKRILRSPFNQAVYKLLHPSIGIALGSFCSGTSRKYNEHNMTEAMLAEYRRNAKSLLDRGSDIVFFAHTHLAELSRWGEKTYCNTGSWMRQCNYATMAGGMARLWRYRSEQEQEELPAIER